MNVRGVYPVRRMPYICHTCPCWLDYPPSGGLGTPHDGRAPVANRKNSKPRLTEQIALRLPPALPPAIEAAAERRFVSVSEYMRLALVSQLNADGINIWALAAKSSLRNFVSDGCARYTD